MARTTMALTESKENNFNFECPISSEIMENPVLTACGHSFEESNIKEWITKSNKKDEHGQCENTCPICLKPINIQSLRPNFALKAVLPFIKIKTQELEREKKQNDILKTKLHSSELILASEEGKEEKKSASATQTHLTLVLKGTSALDRLLQDQKEALRERATLMATTVAAIKAANKKRLFIHSRLNEAQKTLAGIDEKLPATDPLFELKTDALQQQKKYTKLHTDMLDQIHLGIIDPYITKLTTLNKRIEKNQSDLQLLRKNHVNVLTKATCRSKMISAFSATLFGGEKRMVKAAPPVEIPSPLTPPKPAVEAKAVSVIESAKQSLELINALRFDDYEKALLALQRGANPNFKTKEGNLLLIEKIQQNDLNAMRLLLEYKADPNLATGERGHTPLFWAGYNHYHQALLLLLEFGANPKVKDQNGRDVIESLHAYGKLDPFIADVLRSHIQEDDKKLNCRR